MSRQRYAEGLTRKQKYALILLEHVREPGVVTSGRTALIDGQAWIHWRTAKSLDDRGMVRVSGDGEETTVSL